MTLHYQPSNIQELCQASMQFVMQMAMQKNIQMKLHCTPLIQSVALDERRIRQVLINLLSNAVKFTPEGGKITIDVSVEEEYSCNESKPKYWLCLAVIDTGIGISDDELNKLFQPFIQVNNSLNRQYDGTGLGLALVKRIVRLHGGYINVSSKVGSGSKFEIKLPYTIISLNPNISYQGESTDRISEIEKFTKLPTILLLENKVRDSFTIISYLESRQYQVVTPSDNQQVIDIIKSIHLDLVIINLGMQDIDGLEMIKQIRLSNSSDIPIIVLSSPSDREKYLAQGANECVIKPFKLRDLFQTIHTLLEN
jgi:CheY-like chemotaxis protein